MRFYIKSSILTVVAIFLLSTGVAATVWHVDGVAGSDENSGLSEEEAFATIQRGVDAASPGDAVLVAPGVYHELVAVDKRGSEDAPIIIKARDDGLYQTVITGALREIRERLVTWHEDEGNPGVYWIPFGYRPVRVLADRVDLLAYQNVEHLLAQKFVEDDYPANRGGQAWDVNTSRLYVRLDQEEISGTNDPNLLCMAVSPPTGDGKWGYIPKGDDSFLIRVPYEGPAHIVIDGFTFETPGLGAVYTEADDLTVRNCWFFGCRYGVMGDNEAKTQRVLVEHCFYTQYPAFSDIVTIVREKVEEQRSKTERWHRIMHWQRKGGTPPSTRGIGSDHSYETGLVRRIGKDWTVKNNWLWEVFEGFSSGSVAFSKDSRITHNRIERVGDNAMETEEHANHLTIAHNLIVDAFEPISWQPLSGFPLPGPIYIHDNIIIQTQEATRLWQTAGNNGGVFKIGAKDDRNWVVGGVGMTPEDVTSAPGGFWVVHNTVLSRQGRMFTALNPQGRRYENFYFINNVVATKYFSQHIREPWPAHDIFFAHNVIHFSDGFEEDRLIAAGDEGVVAGDGLFDGVGDWLVGKEPLEADLECGFSSHHYPLGEGKELVIPVSLPMRARVGAVPFVDEAGPRRREDAVAWIRSLPDPYRGWDASDMGYE